MSSKLILLTLLTLACPMPGGLALAAEAPDQISLDTMVELFEGVEFDHAMHSELGEDCSVCHHHTTGTGTVDERCISCHADGGGIAVVACRSCHVAEPFSAEAINRVSQLRYQFHVDKPGLKAAFHWNCVACHEVMDGPVECQSCHTRTAAGDAFYHAGDLPRAAMGGH